MIEDEDYDDLPNIFVNCSPYDAKSLRIPSVKELALQREQELENERKLQDLCSPLADEVSLSRHDSSSSESDAALAAAVNSMRVCPSPLPSSQYVTPSAADLMAAVGRCLPSSARRLLNQPDIATRLPQVVRSLSALVAADGELWEHQEVLSIGGFLAAAALAHDGPTLSALRALHTLLNLRATKVQAQSLLRILLNALPKARARLDLSDALRCGGEPACVSLATLVLDVALLELLDPSVRSLRQDKISLDRLAEAMSMRFADLDTDKQFMVMQLLGRRLAHSREEEHEARERILAPLAQAHIGHETQNPDKLKVLVYASKLRLLFADEQ